MTTYIIIASVLLLFFTLGYFRHKRARSKVVHVVDENCTRCQRCVKKCRRKALEVVNTEAGRRIVLNPNKCTACGDCLAVCKFNALEIVSRGQVESSATPLA